MLFCSSAEPLSFEPAGSSEITGSVVPTVSWLRAIVRGGPERPVDRPEVPAGAAGQGEGGGEEGERGSGGSGGSASGTGPDAHSSSSPSPSSAQCSRVHRARYAGAVGTALRTVATAPASAAVPIPRAGGPGAVVTVGSWRAHSPRRPNRMAFRPPRSPPTPIRGCDRTSRSSRTSTTSCIRSPPHPGAPTADRWTTGCGPGRTAARRPGARARLRLERLPVEDQLAAGRARPRRSGGGRSCPLRRPRRGVGRRLPGGGRPATGDPGRAAGSRGVARGVVGDRGPDPLPGRLRGARRALRPRPAAQRQRHARGRGAVAEPLAYVGVPGGRMPLLVGGETVLCSELPQRRAVGLRGTPAADDGLVRDVIVA